MSRDSTPGKSLIRDGIRATGEEEYLLALNLLTEAYTMTAASDHPDGLSFLGLCVALVEKRYAAAATLCDQAIELAPGEPLHYVNRVRVHVASGDRMAAVKSCEEALTAFPTDPQLSALRESLGIRARPAVPFLSRGNPVNQALGRALNTKKHPEDDDREKQ